tara:strand:- start:231 stop:545 length:315 start_codon:yes stop_codon:yes gene_type:complete
VTPVAVIAIAKGGLVGARVRAVIGDGVHAVRQNAQRLARILNSSNQGAKPIKYPLRFLKTVWKKPRNFVADLRGSISSLGPFIAGCLRKKKMEKDPWNMTLATM